MMPTAHKRVAIEAVVNTMAGYLIAVLVTRLVYYEVEPVKAAWGSVVFVGVSLARNWVIRSVFHTLHNRNTGE